MLNGKFVDKLSAVAGAIGRQRHLGAIRDGFVTIMPLMIIGSLVTLINNIPLSSGTNPDALYGRLADLLVTIPALRWLPALNGAVWWGTFGMLTIFAVISISYHLAKSYDSNPIAAATVALAAYLTCIPEVSPNGSWGDLHWSYLNAGALFVGIILTLVTTELFIRFARMQKLQIKMPAGVPPAVGRSFAALIPSIFTVLLVGFFASLVSTFAETNFFAVANSVLVAPFTEASGSFGFGFVIVFLTHFFWLFGIHGANIFEGILQPFNAIATQNNLAVAQSGEGSILIFNKSFADAFIYMGGVGVCLGLVIALMLAGRAKQLRMMGRLGAAPALFNINEPVLFGLPIVLNPIFVIPFLLAPIVSYIVAYTFTSVGLLPAVSYIIPWTTPPILSGLFATGFSVMGPVVQLINLTLSVIIYIPFVVIANKIEARKESEMVK